MSAVVAPAPVAPIEEVVRWAEAQTWSDFAQSIAIQFFQHKGRLTPNQENAIRAMYAKVNAKKADAVVVAEPVSEVGMYRKDGVVYRVKKARGSGNLYAMRYCPDVIGGDRFVYVAGAVRRLSATDRLTLEEAKAIGHQYGQCCVCGADLSDPKSVEAGIGPVCAKKV